MDGIITEMMEAGGEMVAEWKCGLCNQVWESGDVAEDLKNSCLVCIPKKGNNVCHNWRGLTLLSIPGKMYCQMILKHMWDIVDDKLVEEWVGFRPRLSCAEQIFTLHHIIEKI